MGRRPAKTPQERVEATLESFRDWLCANWGFCGANDAPPANFARDKWTVDEFAEEILRAEGISSLETDYRKQIRDEFVRRFGASLSVADFDTE
jgi:hypothetical protein